MHTQTHLVFLFFFYSKLYHSIVEFANLIGQLQITGWYTAFIFKKKNPIIDLIEFS